MIVHPGNRGVPFPNGAVALPVQDRMATKVAEAMSSHHSQTWRFSLGSEI
jgi:hypothetical protein